MLESLTTMPTLDEHLNAFWAGEPSLRAKKGKSSKQNGKKRKRSGAGVAEIDTSTGIFDDSDDDESDGGLDCNGKQEKTSSGLHELRTLSAHRKVFSTAWRTFLATGLSEDEIKRVLVMLHRQVLPHLLEPGMLVDFLADCTDYGKSPSLILRDRELTCYWFRRHRRAVGSERTVHTNHPSRLVSLFILMTCCCS